MALNIGEANDLNIVLRYFLGLDNVLGEKEGHIRARQAAERLADKAHKPLMAGLTGDSVREAWADLELPGVVTSKCFHDCGNPLDEPLDIDTVEGLDLGLDGTLRDAISDGKPWTARLVIDHLRGVCERLADDEGGFGHARAVDERIRRRS